MTLVRRLMLLGAAVGAVALVIAHIATPAEKTHAQTVAATFYGTFDVGDVVVAFINDVSCATATTDADGNWIMQIPTDAPCSPADGDTVTFTRNGALLTAEETWRSGGAPADVANGVPGDLATGATPTPTPTPVQAAPSPAETAGPGPGATTPTPTPVRASRDASSRRSTTGQEGRRRRRGTPGYLRRRDHHRDDPDRRSAGHHEREPEDRHHRR